MQRNRHITLSLITLPALLSAAPADVPQPTAAPLSAVAKPQDIDVSLANLLDLVGRHPGTIVEQLQYLRQQLGLAESADPAPVVGTLPAVIDAVIASARAGFMTYVEAAFVREQVIEARLDRVLDALERRATETGWDPALYAEVRAALVERARIAVGYPDAEAARARLERLLEELRSGGPAAGFDAFRLELVRGRVIRYGEFLVARARTLGVSREVAQPLIFMLLERGRLAVALGAPDSASENEPAG